MSNVFQRINKMCINFSRAYFFFLSFSFFNIREFAFKIDFWHDHNTLFNWSGVGMIYLFTCLLELFLHLSVKLVNITGMNRWREDFFFAMVICFVGAYRVTKIFKRRPKNFKNYAQSFLTNCQRIRGCQNPFAFVWNSKFLK